VIFFLFSGRGRVSSHTHTHTHFGNHGYLPTSLLYWDKMLRKIYVFTFAGLPSNEEEKEEEKEEEEEGISCFFVRRRTKKMR
jgi:hypothetical protein